MGDGEPVRDEDLQKVRLELVTSHDGPIVLVDYDPTWPALFHREAARIRTTRRRGPQPRTRRVHLGPGVGRQTDH